MKKFIKRSLNILIFDYWKMKWITLGIAALIFLFAFILPNSIHNGIIAQQQFVPPSSNEPYANVWQYPSIAQNPFQGNWVAYGFLWLGFYIGGILSIITLIFIVGGLTDILQWLHRWSHDINDNLDKQTRNDMRKFK